MALTWDDASFRTTMRSVENTPGTDF